MPHTCNGKPTQNKHHQTLRILQINVGRSGIANNLALTMAFEKKIDLFLIQEPLIGEDLDRKLSKKHNAYQAFAAEDILSNRPRVITYARQKRLGIKLEKRQEFLEATDCKPDILVLELDIGPNQEPIYMVNIDNAPQGYKKAGESIETIIRAPNFMQNMSLVLGDVNLHHKDWNNWTTNPSEGAINLAEGVVDQEAFYQLEPGTITHNRIGAINLVIVSSTIRPYITECYTEPTLNTTSDH